MARITLQVNYNSSTSDITISNVVGGTIVAHGGSASAGYKFVTISTTRGFAATVTTTPNTGCSFIGYTNISSNLMVDSVLSAQARVSSVETTNQTLQMTASVYQPTSGTILVKPAGGSLRIDQKIGDQWELLGQTTVEETYAVGLPTTYRVQCNSAPAGKSFKSFKVFAGNDTISSINNPETFTITAENTPHQVYVYYANSSIQTYPLSISISPAGSGSVSGAGNYAANSTYTLTATPYTGYQFEGWYWTNDTLVSNANPFYGSMPVGSLSFVAKFSKLENTIQESTYYTNNKWKDGFITTWQGMPERKNTLRGKIVSTNGADLTSSLGSLYKFYYRAIGYLNTPANPVKVQWVLVFQPANAQGNPNPISNTKYVHTFLRVYSNPQYTYGLDQASSTPYTTSSPVQYKSNNVSGKLTGHDLIEAMSSPKNTNSWCQTTCSGEIPYSEINVDEHMLHVEFSRVSFGMLPQQTNAVWYNSNYGQGLTKDANQTMALYHTANTTNVSHNDLVAPQAIAPEVVSYHQANVQITGDECFLLADGSSAWQENTLTIPEITSSMVQENNKLDIISNYWVGLNASNNYYSTCNAFYNHTYVPIQVAPKNIQYEPVEVDEDELRIDFKKHTPVGNNGYFNCLEVYYIDDNNQRTLIKTLNQNFYNQDISISLFRSEFPSSAQIGSFTIALVPKCNDGQIVEAGDEIILNFAYAGLSLMGNPVVYFPSDSNDNAVLYEDKTGKIITNVCLELSYRNTDWEEYPMTNYVVELVQEGSGTRTRINRESIVQSQIVSDYYYSKIKLIDVDLTDYSDFVVYIRDANNQTKIFGQYNFKINFTRKPYNDYSSISHNKLVDVTVIQSLFEETRDKINNYTKIAFNEYKQAELSGGQFAYPYEQFWQDWYYINSIDSLQIDYNIFSNAYGRALQILTGFYLNNIDSNLEEFTKVWYVFGYSTSSLPQASGLYPSSALIPGILEGGEFKNCLKADYINYFINEALSGDTLTVDSSDISVHNLINQVVEQILENQFALTVQELDDRRIIANNYGTVDVESDQKLEILNNYQKAMLYMITNML